jgi:ubiquinone/menaquinone biosynthesis C-methylase UbiE
MKSSSPKDAKADYGNWVSKSLIWYPGLLAVMFLELSVYSRYFLIVAFIFIFMAAYFAYAYHEFSPKGRDIQAKIRRFVLERLEWDGRGRAIDIGCGNGALAIQLAKRYQEAEVTGIDYWEGKWDYSQASCEKNASNEGEAYRVNFRKASAIRLPFEDGAFDAAVSNFVFHEVVDAGNKRDVVREALRVVRKGGWFAFQDLFTVKRLYGNVDDLLSEIRSWGVEDVRFVNTSNADFIPKPLKLPFMVGSIGIIYGRK